jgi:hypothetical protein
VIRLRKLQLPPGLCAVIHRGPDGDLAVFVSEALSAEQQRAAVRVGLRAGRKAGWHLGRLPLPAVALLAATAAALRALWTTTRAHTVATAATIVTSATVATGALLIAVAPHQHAPVSAGRQSAQGKVHATTPTLSAPAREVPRPRQTTSIAPVGKVQVSITPTAASGGGQPATQGATPPAPSTPAPSCPCGSSPAPAPSPSPTPGSSSCVVLLGIWICL